ncbi:hypothetical protein lpa_01683 [Legionella pneumophila 2300/99 Alcoy]|nr:hypothetical protein lpa_01683 [Legionella pneumophila 2300/99 Alcoy]
MRYLAKIIPKRHKMLMKTLVNVSIFEASCQADFSPSVSIFLEKTVIKETERAPSANKSLKRFGARNAIRKIPMEALPNKALNKTSRIRPNTRLHITARAMIPVAFTFSVLSLLMDYPKSLQKH